MRILLIGGVALFFGCGGKVPPQAGATADVATDGAMVVLSDDQQIARAAALLTTRVEADAQEALVVLKPLLVSAADRAEIPFNMGLAYHQLGDALNARKYYLRATAIDPALGAAWLNLGALSERGGQNRRALQHYRAGLRSAPDMGELVVGTIGVLRKMGRHDEAIAEAKTALAKNANNIDVYNNLGLVYIDQGKPDLAQFIYQKALNSIDGAGNNATIHANLGRTFLAKDRPWNAKAELEKALELDPDLVAAMVYLSHLAIDDHDWERTATLLERAAKIQPDNAAIQMNLGIAYRGLGQYELARKSYDLALELDPGNPDPYINISLLLGDHLHDYSGAIAAIQSYRSRGGAHRERADGLLTGFKDRKEKFQADVARKRKRESDRKKREDETRLAAQHEATQALWREEQEKKAAEDEAKRDRAEAAAAAALGAGAAAEAANPGATTEPTRGTRQAGAPCSSDDQCGDGLSCGGGVCASPAEAAPVQTRGSRQVGAPCSSANQCAEGLSCADGACAAASGGGSDWGGW